MKRDIEHKKNHTLRFRPSDMAKWKNKAAKKGISVTRLIEEKLNQK